MQRTLLQRTLPSPRPSLFWAVVVLAALLSALSLRPTPAAPATPASVQHANSAWFDSQQPASSANSTCQTPKPCRTGGGS